MTILPRDDGACDDEDGRSVSHRSVCGRAQCKRLDVPMAGHSPV